MSKINDLIKKLCPNGVEYKSLKDIFELFSGMTGVSNKWADEGNCRFIDYMNAYKNNKIDITKLPYATVKNTKQTTLIQGDLLLTSASEVPDECAIASVIEDEIQDGIFMDDHLFGLRLKDEYKNIINTTFISYYLNSKPFRCNLFKAVRGVTRFYISNKDYMKLNIPIPPIEVQEEIVRILDKFGELEAELEVRKSQYEFWREKLLNNGKYSIVSLGDYATFSQGIQVDPKDQKDYCDDGMVPFLRIVDFVKDDEPPRYIIKPDNKYIKKENEEMVMIRYGASAAGKVFINKYGAIANNMFKINLTTNEIDIKYLWHYLSQDKIYRSLNNTGGGSTMPAINFKMASSIQVVLPPKEEQNRIVKILDKFEELANDITVGLPAEIELRRKQYEYYRNKLLTFEALSVSE